MKRFLKYLYKVLVFYSPKRVKNKLHTLESDIQLKKGRKIAKSHRVSKADLEEIFKKLDLSGDIMLHTSITNLGKVQGGAKFICELLLTHVNTAENTLLISALPYRGSFYEYLGEDPVFDVRTSPIAMGAVNERLAALSGAERSMHPTHSVVAIGKDAHEYISSHHKDDTPFGENSPYRKLLNKGGKILLIGATLNNVTAVHALEDQLGSLYPKDVYADKNFNVSCIDWSGKQLTVKTKCHHPLKCLTRSMERMRKYLVENGALDQYRCGAGFITLIDGKKFVEAFCQMLQNGDNIYGKHKITYDLNKAIDSLKNNYK